MTIACCVARGACRLGAADEKSRFERACPEQVGPKTVVVVSLAGGEVPRGKSDGEFAAVSDFCRQPDKPMIVLIHSVRRKARCASISGF